MGSKKGFGNPSIVKKTCFKCCNDKFIHNHCTKCGSLATKLVEYKNKNNKMRRKVVEI